MRPALKALGALVAVGALGAAVAIGPILLRGVSAREEPTRAEVFLARSMRRLAIPMAMRRRGNPVAATAEVLEQARAHFADHCASCHGNDGKGQTPLGRNLYPRAPDMTLPQTQGLSDGELFAIIENGVRLTGMPGWGSPDPQDDAQTWELVHFIRRLPSITPEELGEMGRLNPISRKELEEEEAIRRFLSGPGDPSPEGAHRH